MERNLFDAYLAGEAGGFFEEHYANAEDRRRSLERASRPPLPVVAEAVERQNAQFSPSPARGRHVAALCGGAPCVVSGQQVGLFLGPLFTLYKAASAVAVARALERESGRTVVPVFWLQTEDHDLPEIAETHVPSEREAPLSLRLPASADERTSIAHRLLPTEVTELLAVLRAELGNLPHASEHLARLERHYRPGVGWAPAFAHVLAELFSEEGLVLLDPREPELARAAAPLHQRALSGAIEIAAALHRRASDLEAAGFSATVHVREGAPLSFFHPTGADGPRYRLTPAADSFVEIGGERHHSLASLLDVLAGDPARFSTSVLLRPILQDSFLSTAAFVGGPAEVSYFGQLAPLYRAYGVPMPLVVPRARLRIIEGKTARLLERLKLRPDDVALPEDELLRRARHSFDVEVTPAELSRSLLDPWREQMVKLRPSVAADVPEIASALEKTQVTVEAAVARLTAKYENALLHRDDRLVVDARRLKALLWPCGMPQERFYGPAYFASRYGERNFVRTIVDAIRPFDATPIDVRLDG